MGYRQFSEFYSSLLFICLFIHLIIFCHLKRHAVIDEFLCMVAGCALGTCIKTRNKLLIIMGCKKGQQDGALR